MRKQATYGRRSRMIEIADDVEGRASARPWARGSVPLQEGNGRVVEGRASARPWALRPLRIGVPLQILLVFALCGCGAPGDREARNGERPRIVATTSIIGDLVSRVGGEAVELIVLIPPGVDPHGYHFTPRDFTRVADADLVFVNGAGLESRLDALLELAKDRARKWSEDAGRVLMEHENTSHSCRHQGHHHSSRMDPHFWTDPHQVMIWIRSIRDELAAIAPAYEEMYEHNAEAYLRELEALDRWIRSAIDVLPPDRRVLVTDHYVFGYFAHRYGFREGGAIVRGLSTLAQPSARDFAELARLLSEEEIPALFIGVETSGVLAERLADDSGIRVVPVYTGALSAPEGPAPDYIAYMRYNVTAFVEGLTH